MLPNQETPESVTRLYNTLQKTMKGKDLKLVDKNGIYRAITVNNNYKAIDFVMYSATIAGLRVLIADDNGYNVEVPLTNFSIGKKIEDIEIDTEPIIDVRVAAQQTKSFLIYIKNKIVKWAKTFY